MTKSSTRTPARQSKQERRRDRREEQRRLEAARLQAAKRNRIIITSIIAVVIIAAAISGIFYFVNGRNSTAQGQTASTSTTNNSSTAVNSAAYPTIDGVSCDKEEQLAYHIHAHLSLYMNGSPVQLPANIGIASDQSCIYWLHVHDTSGVVHIEAPTQKIYTLGTFFHIWGQAFPQMQYPVELESTNDWQVYVNGKLYTGDFHNIPLTAHTLITMAYKSPGITPDTTYNWGEL